MINKKNKVLSAMLSVCMTFTTVPAVFAADSSTGSSDIDGHWAQAALEEFISDGYLNGDGSGNYQPDNSMTRAQYAAIINRVLNYSTESTEISNYTDVSASAWYRADLAKALAAGYMTGTSTTTMSPETAITREQAFAMIARILDLDTATDTSALDAFNDAASVSDWAKQSVAAMIDKGYVSGDNNKNINPQKELTRAEGVTVLNRIKSVLTGGTTSADGTYKDGTYTGTGAGYGGTMTLQVTVKDGKISAIDILSESETSSYLTRAKTIIQEIIDNNGTDGVDAVSGATKSSNGILDAVNACLSQAKGGNDTSTTGSTGGGGGGSGSGSATKPSDDDAVGRWADSTYTGTAEGYSNAGVTAEVTVADGKITTITLTNNGETTSYFNKAMGATKSGQTIIEEIIDTQSTNNIDTVSGATKSSYAIINAIKAALQQASDAVTEAYTFEVSSWAEFNDALNNAVSGDTIKLAADITDAGAIDGVSSATATISKTLTIDGNGKTISAYSDGTVTQITTDKEGNETSADVEATFCFDVTGASGIQIKNLTVDGASFSAKLGGAMYVETGAEVTLDSVTFKNCKAGSTGSGNGGGVIYAEPHRGDSPTVTATNCTFDSNIVNDGSTGRGGAVYGYNANITLENCTFKNNKAAYGGAVAAAGATNLTVTGCTFDESNDAVYGGDDIYVFDGYTFYKKTMAADSAVAVVLSGNTISSGGSDFKDYRVICGRVLGNVSDTTSSSGNTIEKSCAGSESPFLYVGHDLTFDVTDYNRTGSTAPTEDTTEYTYMLMNIPYDEFYAAELGNNTKSVDAVTSATSSKWKNSNLVNGSYHEDSDSGKIKGAIYPVVVEKDADYSSLGGSEVTDSGNLFEASSYSYCLLNETPAYYKVLTLDKSGNASFSAAKGIVTTLSDADVSFGTETSYGDYIIDFSGLTEISSAAVYGVLVKTDDGYAYGMRHLENIWRKTEIAWSTGFVIEERHGNKLSYEHYVSMMGKTIDEIVYYTSEGIFSIPVEIYVPIKFTNTFEVADSDSSKTTVTATGFPENYDAVYTVTDSDGVDVTEKYGFTCTGTELSWTGSPLPGEYTLTVSDGKGVYDSVSDDFIIKTDTAAAEYDSDDQRLVKATGSSKEEFENYMSNITSVSVNGNEYPTSGRNSVTLINEDGFIDFNTTPFASMNAGDKYTVAVTATGYSKDLEFDITIPEYIYAYASLSYAEYWEAEGVYDAGDTTSSSETDAKGETDKGAFDAVTRATTNHGLHRGSFQQVADLYVAGSDEPLFTIASWSDDGSSFTATDGTVVSYSKGTMTYTVREGRNSVEKTAKLDHYVITGIKYVPVAIPAGDYAAFCSVYSVTQNGEEMAGGYSEKNLSAYTYTAYVTADTNGLKIASKSGDSWSFGARQTGTGSGILDGKQASCSEELTVKDYSGSYGEFLRADMTENYGELGAAMQTVRWDYYGDGDTILASYGTKFAADNWMHKSMGIQLGLTESLRCQLPEGTDGSGKWVVTIYGLGFADYTDEITVTSANLPVAEAERMTDDQKKTLTDLKDQAYALIKDLLDGKGNVKSDVTATTAQSNLIEHYNEAVDMLEKAETNGVTKTAAEELIGELPDLIESVKSETATASAVEAEAASGDEETAAETAEPAAEQAEAAADGSDAAADAEV